MNYVLDTNILLFYLRDSKTKEYIESLYDPLNQTNNPIISIVTVGEIRSIAKRNHWGGKRLQAVEALMGKLIVTDIKYEAILDSYAEIDAFSQDRISDNPLGMTARNMGKNDLWIAATTVVTNSILITADSDFNHLDKKYFEIIQIQSVK